MRLHHCVRAKLCVLKQMCQTSRCVSDQTESLYYDVVEYMQKREGSYSESDVKQNTLSWQNSCEQIESSGEHLVWHQLQPQSNDCTRTGKCWKKLSTHTLKLQYCACALQPREVTTLCWAY